MLRLIFVIGIILVGVFYSRCRARSTALLFYLWNAYFRPDDWTYGAFIMSLQPVAASSASTWCSGRSLSAPNSEAQPADRC